MNVVTAVRRPVGIAARTNQRRRRRLLIRSTRAPAVPAAASARWLDGIGRAGRRRHHHPDAHGGCRDDGDEDADPRGPERALGRQAEGRLEEERIGEQCHQRCPVAQRVEPVRVDGAGGLRVAHRGVPRRQERRRGGQQERRRPDRDREDREQVQRGREPRVAERRPVGGCREKQAERRDRHAHVDHRTSTDAETGHRDVAVEVAQQQDALEEREDGGPRGGHATEDRQHQAPHERLDREEQERGEADARPVDRRASQHAADPRRAGRWRSRRDPPAHRPARGPGVKRDDRSGRVHPLVDGGDRAHRPSIASADDVAGPGRTGCARNECYSRSR